MTPRTPCAACALALTLAASLAAAPGGHLARWRAARAGDAAAKLALGLAYLEGEGVPADPTKAFMWIRRAAEAGLAAAQDQLAGLYYDGRGVPKDLAASVRWRRKAAEQGHAQAAFHLGAAYKLGSGVAEDQAEGARWLEVAAEGGHAKAQHQLGVAYYTGKGVAPDLARAVEWVRRAADQGWPQAITDLGVLDQRGEADPMPADPTARLQWLRRRAPKGPARLKQALAVCYADGLGTARDDAAAMKWFRAAARAGDPDAQLDLGIRLLTGEGGATKDPEAGREWLQKAARAGRRQARRLLRVTRPAPKRPPPTAARQRTAAEHLDAVFAELDARQRARDAYISQQRRAFNDYLDRTNSTFGWRYR